MNTLLMPTAARSLGTPASSAELALMLLGPSAPMSQLWAQIRRLAPYARTVLLAGSPASGQEAVARLLLDLSPWPQRSFLALREAEAEERLSRPGVLNTLPTEVLLFLPEVDRLSPPAQQGLLRLLRVHRSRAFSVVTATAEDLRSLVGMGRFSAELADALGTLHVKVPSLKERTEDIPMLLSQALSMRCQANDRSAPQLSEEILRAAMEHSWPGNLHELGSVADRLLANSAPGDELGAADLRCALHEIQGVDHLRQGHAWSSWIPSCRSTSALCCGRAAATNCVRRRYWGSAARPFTGCWTRPGRTLPCPLRVSWQAVVG